MRAAALKVTAGVLTLAVGGWVVAAAFRPERAPGHTVTSVQPQTPRGRVPQAVSPGRAPGRVASAPLTATDSTPTMPTDPFGSVTAARPTAPPPAQRPLVSAPPRSQPTAPALPSSAPQPRPQPVAPRVTTTPRTPPPPVAGGSLIAAGSFGIRRSQERSSGGSTLTLVNAMPSHRLRVGIHGPKDYTREIEPGGSVRLPLQPGEYSITASGSLAQTAPVGVTVLAPYGSWEDAFGESYHYHYYLTSAPLSTRPAAPASDTEAAAETPGLVTPQPEE